MTNSSNKIFAVFAVLVFALNLFYASFIWIDFKVNQEFIANNLCVEKDIQESTCQGSCHLKKELEKVEENKGNSQQNPINIAQSKLDVLFLNDINIYQFTSIILGTKNSFFTSKRNTQKGYSSSIFHPPIIS